MEALQLYSKGMEYYESIRSYKFMYFERKMNSILRSEKVLNSLGNQQKKEEKEDETQRVGPHVDDEKMRLL